MGKDILVREVTSSAGSFFQEFLSYMPNPDLLLEETGENISIYRKMLLDGRISSLLKQRKDRALSFPWIVRPIEKTPRAEKIAEGVREILKGLNFSQELKELLSALEFGFAVTEIIWKLEGGMWIPAALKARRQERFAFRRDGTLVLIDPAGERVLTENYKFIVHRHDPQAENPYGSSVLRLCYWPWVFKRAGYRFWMTAAEKFGVPTIMAIFETDNEDEAQKRAEALTQALAGIATDSALAVANIKDIKPLEAKGGLADFRELIDCCNTEIAYALTGQNLAVQESKHGTRAQAEVHERVFDLFAIGDARELAWTLQKTLIAWVVELNWGKSAPVPVFEFDTKSHADWDQVKDAIDRGIPLSASELYDRYALPRPKDDEDVFISPSFEQTRGVELADDVKKKTLPFLKRL